VQMRGNTERRAHGIVHFPRHATLVDGRGFLLGFGLCTGVFPQGVAPANVDFLTAPHANHRAQKIL